MSALDSVSQLIEAALDGPDKDKAYENLTEENAKVIMLRRTDEERMRTLNDKLLKSGTKCHMKEARKICSKMLKTSLV